VRDFIGAQSAVQAALIDRMTVDELEVQNFYQPSISTANASQHLKSAIARRPSLQEVKQRGYYIGSSYDFERELHKNMLSRGLGELNR
jgi:hypothetical protein